MPEKGFKLWLAEGIILAWRNLEESQVVSFRVVLLAEIEGQVHCVARYDTAHGAAHQDILGKSKGTLAKHWFFESSHREVFEHAIHDLQAHADYYIRFFREN